MEILGELTHELNIFKHKLSVYSMIFTCLADRCFVIFRDTHEICDYRKEQLTCIIFKVFFLQEEFKEIL